MSVDELAARLDALEARMDREASGDFVSPMFTNMNPDGTVNFVFPSNVAAAGLDLSEAVGFANPSRLRWLDAAAAEWERIYGIFTGGQHQIRVGLGGAPQAADPILIGSDGHSQFAWLNNVILTGAGASAALALNGVLQDIPGAVVNVTTQGANGRALVFSHFDFDRGSTSTSVGEVIVDGVAQSTQAILRGNVRAVVGQVHGLLLPAGAHQIKLAALDTGGVGNSDAQITHTNLVVIIFDFA